LFSSAPNAGLRPRTDRVPLILPATPHVLAVDAIKAWRPGKTVAYAESWANAWGHHGGTRDRRWCSPCQWNYWRLLVDLHCGVSFITVYGDDLQAAKSEPEFAAAFAFAKKYAGLHASPSKAPGAWVAMREGKFLQGDYNFLMERLEDPVEPVRLVGPSDQRYGAWALEAPSSGKMRLRVDRRFLRAHMGQPLRLRVTYLDNSEGRFEAATGQWRQSRKLTNSGRWDLAEWAISVSDIPLDSDHHVELQTADIPITLHMIELTKSE
jgi:hypothetical protein